MAVLVLRLTHYRHSPPITQTEYLDCFGCKKFLLVYRNPCSFASGDEIIYKTIVLFHAQTSLGCD